MLIHKQYFDKVGFFDENYFMYWEDCDWCVRARKKGYKINVEPKSIVFHSDGGSFSGNESLKYRYLFQTLKIFIFKHSSIPLLSYFFAILIRIIKYTFTFNLFKLRILLKSIRCNSL